MPNRGYTTLFEFDKEIAAAFKADCEEFLEEFDKLNSFDFVEFARLWRKKQFTYVFAGHRYALLLRDYVENCFFVVKKFIVFPQSLQTQVGALFLLYGLYHKQPLMHWVKVRLTFEDYQKIMILLEEMKSRGHLDPVYIFSKMKVEQAFVFVAQRKPLGPEDRFIKSFEIFYNDTFSLTKVRKVEQNFAELISESQLVKELSKTDSQYQELLKQYSAKCSDLVPMKSTILTTLQSVHNKIISNEALTEAEATAKSKRNLKNKAMANKNAVYRGSRPIKTMVDLNSQPSGSGISKKPVKK